MNKTELKQNVTKINKLIRSGNYEGGIELALTLNNRDINKGIAKTLSVKIKKILKIRDYKIIDSAIEIIRKLDEPSIVEYLLKDVSLIEHLTYHLDIKFWALKNYKVDWIRKNSNVDELIDQSKDTYVVYSDRRRLMDGAESKKDASENFNRRKKNDTGVIMMKTEKFNQEHPIGKEKPVDPKYATDYLKLNGVLSKGNLFEGSAPAQVYLDYALFSLIGLFPTSEKSKMLIDNCICIDLSYEVSTARDLPMWELPKTISVFKNIRVLDLGYGLTTNSSSLTNIDAIGELENLEVLIISGNRQLQFKSDTKIFSKLNNLKLLKCDKMDIDNIDFLLNCKSLEKLDLKFCSGIKNEDHAKLEKALPNTTIGTRWYMGGNWYGYKA